MKLKNIVLASLFISFIAQPKTDQQTIKQEKIIKVLKIAGYSAELLSALYTYSLLQYLGWDQELKDPAETPAPTLKMIPENIVNGHFAGALGCSMFQVPFFVTMIHAINGLKRELRCFS